MPKYCETDEDERPDIQQSLPGSRDLVIRHRHRPQFFCQESFCLRSERAAEVVYAPLLVPTEHAGLPWSECSNIELPKKKSRPHKRCNALELQGIDPCTSRRFV